MPSVRAINIGAPAAGRRPVPGGARRNRAARAFPQPSAIPGAGPTSSGFSVREVDTRP